MATEIIQRYADLMLLVSLPRKTYVMEQTRIFIRAAELRRRWDDMPASTFYWRLKRGVIPKPEYPFGEHTPYWRLSVIEKHEASAQ